MRILLVEDDELLGDGVRVGLNHYGHVVDWVKDGTMALRAIKTDTFDVIVLEWRMFVCEPAAAGLTL